ncbi:hypothetical protein MHI24_02040 [Paenibacillus sp. FSL K6-1096]|uniref:hypothetical protein n=1 Tax=Paenibacillus sp. FSL K6-1096 TaxID=2921460 RepID=UPI0030EF7702
MLRRLSRRVENFRRMQQMRKEHPDEIRRLLEEQRREREKEAPPEPRPAKTGPWIIFFRCLLYLVTAVIILVTITGATQSDTPVFSVLAFGLLLNILYMGAALAQPAIVFFRRHWSREDVLELFGLLTLVLIVLMVIFRP